MMHRRRFLQTLGLAGMATGLSKMGLSRALAQGMNAEAPKRLIVISHCHGWPYDAWKLRPQGMDESLPWALNLSQLSAEDLSAPLAPLYPHRNRMIPLDCLSLASAELDMDGNRHDTGWVHAWTGNWADFSGVDTRAQSPSLDQLVAAHVARADRLPSLEISVDDSAENGRPISYAPNGARLPVENQPNRVWRRLFGPSVAPDPLVQRTGNALEYAYAEYAALAPRLGVSERQKLDSHFELLHRLSGRLESMANLSCGGAPELPGAAPNYDTRFDTFANLVGAAFTCDVTRVVSLSLGEMPTADFGWDHLTDDVHKGLAHQIYDDPQKHQAMTDYLTMHSAQVSRLVSILENLPDTDGNSVMDNTLIIWGSELANGWHGYQHYCPIIIGGSWHFRTGRYLYRPHDTQAKILTPSGYSDTSGLPHQTLLVSAAQAMGLDTDCVGLKHFQSQTGVRIDLTGPVPDLT
jgi:hypothetical protein